MKWIGCIIDRNQDYSWGLGIHLYTHKHNNWLWHVHPWLVIGPWFIEVRLGRDE